MGVEQKIQMMQVMPLMQEMNTVQTLLTVSPVRGVSTSSFAPASSLLSLGTCTDR